MTELLNKKCAPCEKGAAPMGEAEARKKLAEIPGWDLSGKEIAKTFEFKNFYQTMAFANAVAWVANREDHHPDLELGYKTCRIRYSTHSVGGLSENDFICAAKIEALQK